MLAAASAGTLIAVIMHGGSDKYPGRAQSFATASLTERAPDGTVRTHPPWQLSAGPHGAHADLAERVGFEPTVPVGTLP